MEEDALEDEERTEDKASSSLASSVAEPEVYSRCAIKMREINLF